MAAFAFNFAVGAEADAQAVGRGPGRTNLDEDGSYAESEGSFDVQDLQVAEEVHVTTTQRTTAHTTKPETMEEVLVAPGLTLLKGRITSEQAAELMHRPDVAVSDLVPNVYEGGFKLWEGALDLCRHIIQRHSLQPGELLAGTGRDTGLQGKRVLELGCGHGLPGIVALLAGAEVHFQDFNREVLTQLTIPNVLANMARVPAGGRPKPTARFFAGDWHTVGELLSSKGHSGFYDLILTSESIYNTDTHRRLLECIKRVLQPPLGVVLLAAKGFYHGVGGGVQTFERAVKRDGLFELTHLLRTSEDVLAGDGACSEGGQEQGGDSSAPAAPAGQGGNVRHVLQLAFPASIQPFFL